MSGMNVNVELTNSKHFASWESGSFNSRTERGWACLIADSEAKPQPILYEKNPLNSKRHYLIKVSTGFLVVVTNIDKLPNSRLYSTRILVGRIMSLRTQAGKWEAADGNRVSAVTSSTSLLFSESFLAEKDSLLRETEKLEVFVSDLSIEGLNELKRMVVTSIEKALTPSESQRMFWCFKREDFPKNTKKIEADNQNQENESKPDGEITNEGVVRSENLDSETKI